MAKRKADVGARPEGVDPAVREQFELLEAKVEEVLAVVARLKRENRQLEQKVAELEGIQQKVARRLDAVLDKIDQLT